VFVNMAPVRVSVFDDQPDTHQRGFPPSFGRDSSGKPTLSVQRAEHLVDIHQGRLEFHDQQVGGPFVPRQLVDRAPLAVDREDTSASTIHPGFASTNTAKLSASVE